MVLCKINGTRLNISALSLCSNLKAISFCTAASAFTLKPQTEDKEIRFLKRFYLYAKILGNFSIDETKTDGRVGKSMNSFCKGQNLAHQKPQKISTNDVRFVCICLAPVVVTSHRWVVNHFWLTVYH